MPSSSGDKVTPPQALDWILDHCDLEDNIVKGGRTISLSCKAAITERGQRRPRPGEGGLHTDELMDAVVARETGIRHALDQPLLCNGEVIENCGIMRPRGIRVHAISPGPLATHAASASPVSMR